MKHHWQSHWQRWEPPFNENRYYKTANDRWQNRWRKTGRRSPRDRPPRWVEAVGISTTPGAVPAGDGDRHPAPSMTGGRRRGNRPPGAPDTPPDTPPAPPCPRGSSRRPAGPTSSDDAPAGAVVSLSTTVVDVVEMTTADTSTAANWRWPRVTTPRRPTWWRCPTPTRDDRPQTRARPPAGRHDGRRHRDLRASGNDRAKRTHLRGERSRKTDPP